MKSFIPVPKRKTPEIPSDSKEAPHKQHSGGKKNWKDNKSKLLFALSPSLPETDSNLLSVTLSTFPKLWQFKVTYLVEIRTRLVCEFRTRKGCEFRTRKGAQSDVWLKFIKRRMKHRAQSWLT